MLGNGVFILDKCSAYTQKIRNKNTKQSFSQFIDNVVTAVFHGAADFLVCYFSTRFWQTHCSSMICMTIVLTLSVLIIIRKCETNVYLLYRCVFAIYSPPKRIWTRRGQHNKPSIRSEFFSSKSFPLFFKKISWENIRRYWSVRLSKIFATHTF